jgi:glycosyltransferase involved in cell wall biosynthesis
MPVSRQRLESLPAPADHGDGTVVFIGSVYPPRSVFLERLGERLAARGVALRVNGDKYGTSNEDYWRTLATSGVIVTTTLQGMPRAGMDWIWIQQLVFRFSEALAAGAVLVAPSVDGGDRFFTPGEDFATFTSLDEAADVLARLATDPAERARLRERGAQTGRRLVLGQVFWRLIDESLASAGSPPLRG